MPFFMQLSTTAYLLFQGKSFFKFLFSGETDLEKFEARKRKRVKG
jgi:hypothetical protein